MEQEPTTRPDPFDRIIGDLTGLPDHMFARPATVATVMPILGRAQTYVIRTCRTPGNRFVGFIEMIEADRHIRIVIPEKAMAAIYRQREGLVTRSRRILGREQAKRRAAGDTAAPADTTPVAEPGTRSMRELLRF